MRGKGIDINKIKQGERITPAHAGKSVQKPYHKQRKKDHPRTCGEKRPCTAEEPMKLGSPPHMRGKESYFNARPIR